MKPFSNTKKRSKVKNMKGIAFYDLDFFKQKSDKDLLKESITRILLTSKGERLNNPEFGSNLQRFLFSQAEFEEIEEDIKDSLARWEPRVSVQHIFTKMVEINSVKVSLVLYNRESTEIFSYEVVLNL